MKMSVKYYRGKDRKILQATLRDQGFRSTEGRLELLSLLESARRPLSVPAIAAKLVRQLDEVNVYRTLEALTRARILSRSDLRHGGVQYELAHKHHHHLVCTDCGQTEDVKECLDKNIEQRIINNSKTFASINTHALEFFGMCRDCVQKV